MEELKLSDFKVVKNRQRPEVCYAYEKYNSDKSEKYSIFTLDGGNTFLCSVSLRSNSSKAYFTYFSDTFNSANEGLIGIIDFLKR